MDTRWNQAYVGEDVFWSPPHDRRLIGTISREIRVTGSLGVGKIRAEAVHQALAEYAQSSDEDSLLCGASDKGTPPRRSSDKQKPSTRNGQSPARAPPPDVTSSAQALLKRAQQSAAAKKSSQSSSVSSSPKPDAAQTTTVDPLDVVYANTQSPPGADYQNASVPIKPAKVSLKIQQLLNTLQVSAFFASCRTIRGGEWVLG
uniref:Uncharacterized protein n=1 Tax=Plectus sambesii TaxID=2011161 RepID=A0A914VQX9_9BILA